MPLGDHSCPASGNGVSGDQRESISQPAARNYAIRLSRVDSEMGKGSGSIEPDPSLFNSLTMSYFHTGTRTIIGAKAFHCPVRDGKEWDHLAMVIRLDGLPRRPKGAAANS